MLHIVNHMSLPVSWFKSYSAYSGATDAMVQWWYGHNAVGFFLTTGFLGMMYYFVPKQGRITPWALSADVADERRMTASGYSPYGAEAQSGGSGVCRANNAMGVIRRCRG